MATYQEMHRIAHDPAAVRDLARRLLKVPSHEWTDWEVDFLENMAAYKGPDPISMRQREVLLALRDETEFHSRISGISVNTLVKKCYEYRLDLGEDDAAWIEELWRKGTFSLKRRNLGRLRRCSVELGELEPHM
jgi:hypothetical protein